MDEGPRYILRLFVAGSDARAVLTLENIRAVCEVYLHNNYSLDVIDVQQDTAAATEYNVQVTPSLLMLSPSPPVVVVGDMTHVANLLAVLRLISAETTEAKTETK
ncbi:MAG: circadian clock protein KaiB [Anaerolineae bacterium]|nr:circadian clock protein KaiB [Anaerolineae bacterium]